MMAEIDPTKIAAIFRALSSEKSDKVTKRQKNAANNQEDAAPAVAITKVAPRDKTTLRKNIVKRLTSLKKDKNFSSKAPMATVQEILLWEFGEHIINHPDFNHLSQSITQAVAADKHLTAYLNSFIAEI
jgi:hypothetical protein